MPKSKLIPALTYIQLLRAIRKEIAEGKGAIVRTLSERYWNMGNYISDYVLNGRDRARYGERVFEHFHK